MYHFISYGDERFQQSRQRILQEAKDFGVFSTCRVYHPEDISEEFKQQYNDVFTQPRIGGYGIWKPWIIKDTMDKVNEGDIIVYADAGCKILPTGMARFIDYVRMLNSSEYGIISFQMPHLEKWYTTREIFEYFGCTDRLDITDTGQILDTVLIMKKCPHLELVIGKWLETLKDNRLLFTDHYNYRQATFFIDNRHNQAIFSVVRKLFGSIIIPQDETFDTVVPWYSNNAFLYPFWAIRIKC